MSMKTEESISRRLHFLSVLKDHAEFYPTSSGFQAFKFCKIPYRETIAAHYELPCRRAHVELPAEGCCARARKDVIYYRGAPQAKRIRGLGARDV